MIKDLLMEENKTMGSSKTPEESLSEEHTDASSADLEGKKYNISSTRSENNRKINLKIFLEFESVSAELDNLNSVLDTMESNVDNIKDQLISILMSNREILKELKEENQKSEAADSTDEPMPEKSET